jgi:hypothetical protein
VPKFDCIAPNADGTFTAFFGYKNDNGVHLDVPYGTKNVLALDTPGFRPTRFLPGEHHFVFGVDFTAAQTVTYELSPTNSPTTTLSATKNSPRCSTAADECGGFCRALVRSGCTNIEFAGCFDGCASLANDIEQSIPACAAANSAWNECTANTAPRNRKLGMHSRCELRARAGVQPRTRCAQRLPGWRLLGSAAPDYKSERGGTELSPDAASLLFETLGSA